MSFRSTAYRLGGYIAARKPVEAKKHQIGAYQQAQLPPKVDLRPWMTTVESQVGNSCVANAFVGAYEYLAKQALGDAGDVSRLFVYYNARCQDGDDIADRGTQMISAIQALVEYGACTESTWPNDETLLCDEPHGDAYTEAERFKIVEAEQIETDLDHWRHTLAEGYPIAFALNTFESFDEATRNRGRIPLPKASDNVRETHGWHAMLCVGYSDKDQMFIVRNSWGAEWGDQGYCYLPYKYVIHPEFNGHDSWIIKSVTDLEFSPDNWGDDESFFADDDELLLFDFYIVTDEPEEFIEDLDGLCGDYADEDDESYYFDYEYEENEEGEGYVLTISNFSLTIYEPDEFLEELDELCEEYALDGDYDYTIDGEEEEEEEDEEAEEA